MIKMCLADICSLNMGQSPNSSSYNTTGEGIPFYQGNADFGKVSPKTTTWCTEPKKIAEPGDILLSVRAPIGAINIANEKCCIGRGLVAISPASENIRASYIKQALLASRKSLEFLGSGSTFKAIGKKSLGEFLIPVYSLPMQIEIENRFSQVSICIELLRDVLKKLDELVKSRFVEMFKVNHYEKLQLSEIGKLQSGGTPARSCTSYFEGDIDWYSAGELNQFKLAGSKEKITQKAIKESSAKLFPAGSLLIGMYDTAALKMGSIEKPSSSNQACACFTPHTDMELIWLFYEIDYQKPKLLARRNGCRQKNLNLGFIKSIEVEFPPLSLQQEFVVFVHQVDKLKFDFDFLVSFSIPSICLFCLKLDP